jgi:hypothetical protein
MKTMLCFCVAILFTSYSAVLAQEPAKPGPEHDMLKKWEGTWDATMKMAGAESKC